jgi:hypothetical protein
VRTYAEAYDPAMKIADQAEADAYFEDLVGEMISASDKNREEAEKIIRCNLGYWAGYFDRETQKRVWRLFSTEHPIFGRKCPTAEEAFMAGVELGKKLRDLRKKP